MELNELDKARVRFHTGVSGKAGVDAGDLAQIEEACRTIPDDYTYGRVLEQLDICDEAWETSKLTRNGDIRYTVRENYQGDINRAIVRDNAKDQRVWWENYLREVDELARLLWVPNYRQEGMDRFRFERSAGAFISIIPGVADTSVSSRRLEFSQLAGSFGF